MSALTGLPSIDAVFARLVDSVAVYERSGRIVYFNPTTEQLFGLKGEDVAGQVVWDLFPAARGNAFHHLFKQVAADGRTRSFEHYYAPWDCWYDNSIYGVGDHVVVWGRDVTQIKRDAERLEFLWQCSERLAQAGVELGGVTLAAAQAIVRSWADTSGIAMFDGVPGELRVVAWSVRTAPGRLHAPAFLPGTKLRAGARLFEAAISRGEPVLVEQADPALVAETVPAELRRAIEAYPPRSFMLAPLRVGERVIGLLQATRQEHPRPFHHVDLQLLQELADRVSLAIHNAQLFAAQEEATRRAELLQKVSAALSRAATPGEIAGVVHELVIPALGGAGGGLLLLAEDGEHLDEVVGPGEVGGAPPGPGARQPMSMAPPATEAVGTGQPVYLPNGAEFAQRFPELSRAGAGPAPEAAALLPLRGHAGTIGVLAVRYAGSHPFPPDERSLIETVALFCSQALERARLYEVERRSAMRERLLADASRTLARSKLAVAELAQRVVETAGRELGEGCALLLRGAEPGTLQLQSVWHPDAARQDVISRVLSDGTARVGAGIAGTVLATGEAAFLPGPHEAERAAAASPLLRALVQGQPVSGAIVVPLRVEGEVLGTLAVTRCPPSPPYTRGHLDLLQELADLAALAIANAQNFERVQQSDRAKDEFLAMLAHELRNPLAPIGSAAQMLGTGRLDAERTARISEVISRQVRHMTGLVDDLLDVSRVTRGIATLQMGPVDATQVVVDALDQVRPLVEARRHVLHAPLLPQAAPLLGDHKRLVQVLVNLLNNAAKYTREGGCIRLDMEVEGGQVRWTVSDNGIGMDPGLVERAFELFVQAERTADRSQGGLGIGLALVKSLVELHGGRVTAHSAGPGQGSTFSVCLPLAAQAQPPARSETLEGPQLPGRGLRLLVVDDNVDAASLLGLLLQEMGHEVIVEHDPVRALQRAVQARPHACLLDIGLPKMNGNELARRLRALPETCEATLIAVTGYGQGRDRERSAAAGFDHHFMKPVDARELSAVLSAVEPSAAAR